MDREKQINEIARIIARRSMAFRNPNVAFMTTARKTADSIYNADYRKQSEGKWEKFEGERFICSNCAKVFGLGSAATIYDVKRVWKYCPNCGAKMSGGEE